VAQHLDCLIVGGGPAGLTAATYLARYRRNILLLDDGQSRARLIPESHNYPGFAGISGSGLLEALRLQAERHGARMRQQRVDGLRREPDGTFVAQVGADPVRASRVLLATGIVDESPEIPGLREVIYRGAIRFCPICDAYEAMDRRIGVLGRFDTACKKALFLRTYTRDVALLPTDAKTPTVEQRRLLQESAIAVSPEPVVDIERTGETITVVLRSGERREVDVLYPALGSEVRSDLGIALGARSNESGCLFVDEHQRTSVEGLYAAGDVVSDLDQLAVATGHAAVAATAIHNSLPRNFR
jgi:thioredoxin reductase (NADPH)